MAHTVQQFFDAFKPYAIKDMEQSGILASLTGAQGLIESGHGDSKLTVECNNLFGIKGLYNGQGKQYWTWEYENGKRVRRYCWFRKYPSWQESINDHSALFNRAGRYKNLRFCQDYEEACINVKKDGYATAPDYTQTLLSKIKKNKLWLWDYEVLKDYDYTRLRTIKKGSDGGSVYLLQTLLNKNGFNVTCDANFGPETENALINYQTFHSLNADGICGPKTWKSIKK